MWDVAGLGTSSLQHPPFVAARGELHVLYFVLYAPAEVKDLTFPSPCQSCRGSGGSENNFQALYAVRKRSQSTLLFTSSQTPILLTGPPIMRREAEHDGCDREGEGIVLTTFPCATTASGLHQAMLL